MLPNKSDLKRKILACENICGTHVTLNEPVITGILGGTNFDFLWVDTEHTSIGYHDLLRHLTSAGQSGTPALVRVSTHDPNHVKRVLEMGPDGIIFPMIETADEADAAMKSCMYPPLGTRGFGPLRVVRYGFDDVNEHIRSVDANLCRFIQVESALAVKNLPEIVKNPYIDGYIFGPCDLSGSIGELNNVFSANNLALIKAAIAVLKNAHKCIGLSSSSTVPQELPFWHELGINMISSGGDYDYILKGA